MEKSPQQANFSQFAVADLFLFSPRRLDFFFHFFNILCVEIYTIFQNMYNVLNVVTVYVAYSNIKL